MSPPIIPGGLLVAIEGIDGAGKTTLLAALADALSGAGVAVTTAKEPTNRPHGEKLRATAATGRLPASEELTLLLADRAQHVDEVIAPTLSAGGIVLLDRYYFSNIAYQGAAGLDPTDVQRQNEAIAPVPDVLLLLDLPVETGLARIGARGDFANQFERADTLEAARALFLRFLPDSPRGVKIDATQDADAVTHKAMQAVITAIARKLTPSAADVELWASAVSQLSEVLPRTYAVA